MQNQYRNVILFIASTAIFFLAWNQISTHFWPPPPPEEKPLEFPDARLWAGLPGLLSGGGLAPGLADATQLAGQVAVAEYHAGDRAAWVKLPEPEPEPMPEPEPEPTPPEKIERVTLGSDESNLKVWLTSLGGGVERIRLNQFQAADWFGLPETKNVDGAKKEIKLDLVPVRPQPSNLLYAYPEPNASNPYNTLGKIGWKLSDVRNGGDDEVHQAVFTADVPGQGIRLTKTYTLGPKDYHVGFSLKMERVSGAAGPFRYQLAGAHGLPMEGVWYTSVYRNALIGLVDSSGNVWRTLEDARTISIQEGGSEVRAGDDKYLGYAGVATQYFASVIAVDNVQAEGVKQDFLAWARPTLQEVENKDKPFLSDITTRVTSKPVELKLGAPVEHRYVLYNGPVKVSQLSSLHGDKAVPQPLVDRYKDTLHLNTLTDYGKFLWWSDVIISCTNLMHILINFLHTFIGNLGICVILLTLMVRGCMFPLSRKQMAASVRLQEQMQKLQPQVKELEAKYGGDPLELQRKKNELYVKSGINPLAAMGSCWLILLQMPIFMGLYFSLQESIHFRLSTFLWIDNLAAPDMVQWWSQKIPWISEPSNLGGMLYLGPYLNILPIIAVVLMFLQQQLMTPPPTDEQQASQQKMMKYMLIFFGLIFYKVAAGLCIYFIASGAWGLAERKLLPKKKTAEGGSDDKQPPPQKKGAPRKPRGPKNGSDNNGNDGFWARLKDRWEKVLEEARKK